MSANKVNTYLEANPRMMGVLFMMVLLLSQAGNASAGIMTTCAGP